MPITYAKKSAKDDRLAVRLPSKTRFALDLYSRMTGQSASDVINKALESILRDPESGLFIHTSNEDVFLPEVCWDRLATDRFVNLAHRAPELLNEEESVLWKVIFEDQKYWEHKKNRPIHKKIRDDWSALKSKADQLLKDHG